ncbi:MAG: Na+/H+ antiporter, partial [uncultured Friedmanniella sp.]
ADGLPRTGNPGLRCGPRPAHAGPDRPPHLHHAPDRGVRGDLTDGGGARAGPPGGLAALAQHVAADRAHHGRQHRRDDPDRRHLARVRAGHRATARRRPRPDRPGAGQRGAGRGTGRGGGCAGRGRGTVRPHLRSGPERRAGLPLHLRGGGAECCRARLGQLRALAGRRPRLAPARRGGDRAGSRLAARQDVLQRTTPAAAPGRPRRRLRRPGRHLPRLRPRRARARLRVRRGLRLRLHHPGGRAEPRLSPGAALLCRTAGAAADRADPGAAGRGAGSGPVERPAAPRHRRGGGPAAGDPARARLAGDARHRHRTPRARRHRLLRRPWHRLAVLHLLGSEPWPVRAAGATLGDRGPDRCRLGPAARCHRDAGDEPAGPRASPGRAPAARGRVTGSRNGRL